MVALREADLPCRRPPRTYMQTVLHSAGRCAIGTIQFVPKAFLEVTKVTMSRKYLINPLTVVPESHTGNDHALFDLFHAYFTAIESTKEQPTI